MTAPRTQQEAGLSAGPLLSKPEPRKWTLALLGLTGMGLVVLAFYI